MSFFSAVQRSCGILPVLVLMASSAALGMPVPLTLDDIAEQAEVIVHGTVADLDSRRETDGPDIYTIVTINVSKLVMARREHAKLADRITLRLEGGTVDGETMATSISPELEKGDEGVFFLARQAGEDVLTLVGGSQGFIPVDGGMVRVEGRRQLVGEFLDDVARRVQ